MHLRPTHGAALALPLVLAGLRAAPPSTILALTPPCPFHAATGLLCPGCGATHAVLALLHGNLHAAWQANPLFLALLPCAALYLALALRRGHLPSPPTSVTASLLVATLLFTIMRNLA